MISCHNVFSSSRIDYDYIKILENVVSTFMIQYHRTVLPFWFSSSSWLLLPFPCSVL
nr:MAG TPA_asm: hypothetical protein [Caudoviricetes sp.]